MKRRTFIHTSAAASGLAIMGFSPFFMEQILRRSIPKSGEAIPVVGLGTWQTFDVGMNLQARNVLTDVLKALVAGGGQVVDSSPMYGSSETVLGDLTTKLGIRSKLFMATKVWTSGKTAGIQQMEESMKRMKTKKMDLIQVHNLVDAKTHLDTLKDWKDAGKVRYIGLTHYHTGGYDKMKRLMLSHDIDFIQINYSMSSLEAEKVLLPLAKDKNIAVLINRPYEGGSLFKKTKGKPLPPWSADIDCHSWGQFFLKFLISNDAVSCVIPGTSKPHHLKDNLTAGIGRLPTDKQRNDMLQYLAKL